MKTFWKNFGLKGVLPLLIFLASSVAIVIIHAATFYGYLEIAEKNRALHRESYLRHILTEAKILENTNAVKLGVSIKQRDDDNHVIFLSEKPLYPLHISQLNYSQLNQLIPKYAKDALFSIQLKNGKWLNYQVQLEPMYLITFVILLLSQLLQMIIMLGLLWYVWRFNHFSPLLDNFRKTAEQLGIDPRSVPLKVHGFSQVQAVANVMNQLQQRILDLVLRRNQLMASISHDLKTPITRLQLQLEFLKDQDHIKEITDELDEMSLLLKQLMYFAQSDPIKEKKNNLDLVSLLQTICDKFVAVGHNVNFHTSLNRAVFFGGSLSLKRAFTNIIDNGVKYGKSVNVLLEKKDNDYVITVDDDGNGIHPEEITKVFQPFYRSKISVDVKPGSGLGLAIAQEAIQAQQGEIKLINREDKGLRVIIRLKNA